VKTDSYTSYLVKIFCRCSLFPSWSG